MFRFNVNWYQTLVVKGHFFYNTSTLDHAAGTNTEMTPLVMSNDKPLPSPAVQLHLMVTHIWWLDMNFASEGGGRGFKGVGQGWGGWTGVWGGLRTWLSKIANLSMQKCACSDRTRQQWGFNGAASILSAASVVSCLSFYLLSSVVSILGLQTSH